MKKLLHFILAVLMVIGTFNVPVKAAAIYDITFVISEGSLCGKSGTFTIEFDDGGPIGEQMSPYSFETVETDSKDHGFCGWSLAPNGGICYSHEELWSLIPSEHMTVYAVYAKTHTVTFNFGEGHWGDSKTYKTKVVEGVLYDFSYIVPEIDDPNLAFCNWRFGTGKVAPYSYELTDFSFSQDITINAEYDTAVNLTLNATEGYIYYEGNKLPSVTYKVAKGYPAQIDPLVGHNNPSEVITNWEDASHKKYNETDPRYLRVNENITLYAIWDYAYPASSLEIEDFPTVNLFDELYLPLTVKPATATHYQIFVESNNAMVVSAHVEGSGIRLYGKTDGMGAFTVRVVNGNGTVVAKTIEVYVKASGDPAACRVFGFCWYKGKQYWYEGGVRQAMMGDPKNIIDTVYGYERGREIYDPDTDGWYWLDCIYDGAKAQSKEVWMPYIYQEDFAKGINKQGKWVRYDDKGKMIKGWYTVKGSDISLYPSQAGNTYYYDLITGEMCKGKKTIDGKTYYFDENTGVLKS